MTFCEIWVAGRTDLPLPSDWLPATEVRRLEGITDATSRRASWTAQALLRLVLSRQLSCPPAQVPLLRHCPRCDSRQHGPLLVPGSGLSVSVAHAGALVVAAVSDADAVGVDVERLPPGLDAVPAPLLDLALSPAEKEHLGALPEAARGRAFRQWWTRKEAVLKACGEGVLGPISEVQLSSLGPSQSVVRWPAASFGRPYWVTDLAFSSSDTVGAVGLTAKPTTMTTLDGDVALREGLHQWDALGHAPDASSWH